MSSAGLMIRVTAVDIGTLLKLGASKIDVTDATGSNVGRFESPSCSQS